MLLWICDISVDLWMYVGVSAGVDTWMLTIYQLAPVVKIWNLNSLLLVIPWFSILHSLCSSVIAAGLFLSFFPWVLPNCNKRGPFQNQSHFECFHSAEMDKHENHSTNYTFPLRNLTTINISQYYIYPRGFRLAQQYLLNLKYQWEF
jgi:hypothetical protein